MKSHNELEFIGTEKRKFVDYNTIFNGEFSYNAIYKDIGSNMLRNSRDLVYSLVIMVDPYLFMSKHSNDVSVMNECIEYATEQANITLNKTIHEIKNVCNENCYSLWTYNTIIDAITSEDVFNLRSKINYTSNYSELPLKSRIIMYFDEREDLKMFEKLYVLPLKLKS